MTSLAKARMHSIFPIERRGDTLIVTPQGDAIGFSPNQIQVEIRGVEKLLAESDALNMIMDLEHTNYFGSEMIGFISRLGTKARQRGGRTAICNVSADMQGILDVMKFDTVWESYDSSRDAIRAVARIPFTERLAGYKKLATAVSVLALIAVGLSYYPWPNRNRDLYQRFISYSENMQQNRKTGQGDVERSSYRKRVEREMRPILKELAASSEEGDLGAAYLYQAGKQCLLPLLTADGLSRSALERDFSVKMTEASKYIEDVAPPEVVAHKPAPRVIRSAERVVPSYKR